MNKVKYNLQFAMLCDRLGLGGTVGTPEELSGGLLHRMFAIRTAHGKYAVKALNPGIMTRPAARSNFLRSERIAGHLAKHIPALAAREIQGTVLHRIEDQWYLVFDWVEGGALKPAEITAGHCGRIGGILAAIHRTDCSELGLAPDEPGQPEPTDWNGFLIKGQEGRLPWATQLLESIDRLCEWEALANRSSEILAADRVISHRDLDPKNVLWHEDKPLLIDWEAAGYIHPLQELTETAVYWAEDEAGIVDQAKFRAFIGSYTKNKQATLQANWRPVLENGFLGKLGWLAYNLKRSLRIECASEEEQRLGTAQATAALDAIRGYAAQMDELEQWLQSGWEAPKRAQRFGISREP